MKKHFPFVILLFAAALTLGCTQVAIDAVGYNPATDRPEIKAIMVSGEVFAEYTTPSCRVTAALFEYNNVLALSLEIRNLTETDLQPKEYSVSLADGRDLKPIKLLTRQDLISTKARIAGVPSGAIQDQLIQATVDTVLNTMNQPTKDKLISIVDQGIADYFAFRPVYANDRRSGVLCFVPDFQLEYPLTVTVRIKGDQYLIKFLPRREKNV